MPYPELDLNDTVVREMAISFQSYVLASLGAFCPNQSRRRRLMTKTVRNTWEFMREMVRAKQ